MLNKNQNQALREAVSYLNSAAEALDRVKNANVYEITAVWNELKKLHNALTRIKD